MSFLRSIGDLIGFLILTLVSIFESIIKTFIPAKYKMKSIIREVVLVTGGGGGLGRLITLRLANLGAIMVIWDVNQEGIEETVKLVGASGGICYGYICDLCNREDIYKKAMLVEEEVGKVTILINNAGVVSGTKFLDTPDKLIIRTMNVNVMSHFWTTKAFLPSMMKDNKGHIVSIASLAGHIGVPKLVDYCTSKFAAIGFEEALHMELAADGYNINTTVVCPFFIRSTGMFDDVSTRFLPRLSPNEVADRVVYAIRCNEKIAVVPRYLHVLLIAKWLFPWASAGMFIRGIISENVPCHKPSSNTTNKEKIVPVMVPKKSENTIIREKLTRRIANSERKP
ncbi:Short-chain dehydrogenase/reductase family 16C member 6 [Eufriesea mexicana]|uniref:Short-chain dehydrogenase/reductase family 16C member 6 n=1 Tax=Eufriesea mexicana TaxID=516756 RepID=A0A310S875_9HYME|nr:PREDICTED: estradiol 17-beta-dehydrogenase 11-like [Eufriesea mexicana]XP_017761482.1 PREDICTED: estradiol 17-beta-dehydrogenase 11-like [Eufriesea mexicana]OAD54371.1 Short-chain dehydrogenase/reductase family 16C member 6 [Eufriesea mexicana]